MHLDMRGNDVPIRQVVEIPLHERFRGETPACPVDDPDEEEVAVTGRDIDVAGVLARHERAAHETVGVSEPCPH
jgi:hypothetical protein